jgi:serine protease Do
VEKGEKFMKSSHLHIPRWVATLAVVAALVSGGILAIGLRNWSDHPVFGAAPLNVTLARSEAPVSLGDFENGFSAVLKPVLPAVVNIHSSKVVKSRADGMMPFFNDPLFQQFFGNQFGQQQARPEREQSLGSGVIITSDGTILTNNHVIDGATDIKVQLSDKREFTAKLVGTDPRTDIAVLKIDASGLPTLAIGDSARLRVGDVVFAVGDPFGVGETATMGIVSATGRSGLGIENYEDFIQTDAAINPGNSGGAMIDLHGNLIGINTAIATGGGEGNVGIGFAIPINMARSVADQLVEHGKVVRGYLGLYPQDVTPEIAKEFGLSGPGGALVSEVSPDSPASKAGLKRGDVILKMNGQPVESANDLRLRISQTPPGTDVKLQVSRDGKPQDVTVGLGEFPEKEANATPGESNGGGLHGVNVQDLTPDLAQELNLPAGIHGVVVSDVDPSSPAAADLQRGDVIQEVNHKPISNVEEYNQAVSAAGSQSVLLLVNRGGVTQYVVVETH